MVGVAVCVGGEEWVKERGRHNHQLLPLLLHYVERMTGLRGLLFGARVCDGAHAPRLRDTMRCPNRARAPPLHMY